MDERFAFGENWSRFLRVLNRDRIRSSEESLVEIAIPKAIEEFLGARGFRKE
jgi:hypothetical protein